MRMQKDLCRELLRFKYDSNIMLWKIWEKTYKKVLDHVKMNPLNEKENTGHGWKEDFHLKI